MTEIKLPPKRPKSAGAKAMENKLDELTTTTYMPRKSELREINDLSHKTGVSKSILIRAALKKVYGIGDDEKVIDCLTKQLNKYITN